HGLEKVQEQDDAPEPNERPPRLPGARDEIGTAGADPCLRNGERTRDEQRRSDDERGIPTHAQKEHPRKKGDHQIPLRGESHGPARIVEFVEGRERRSSPNALVDATAHRRDIKRDTLTGETSATAQMPTRITSSQPPM